ncbi:MAG: hypothetical protein ACRDF5_01800 [bacterium]
MPLDDQTLQDLAAFVHAFAISQLQAKGLYESLAVDSIVLYGGAARFHLGLAPNYDDYDLNVFFRRLAGYKNRDARRFNRRGAFWDAGIFKQKEVQVLFNVLLNHESWLDSARRRQGERWSRIRNSPVCLLYPNRVDYQHL